MKSAKRLFIEKWIQPISFDFDRVSDDFDRAEKELLLAIEKDNSKQPDNEPKKPTGMTRSELDWLSYD